MIGRKCSSHSSLKRPMFRYTRLSAPSAPTESDPSLSTRGVQVVAGGEKYCASGSPGGTKSLSCLLFKPPPVSVSLPHFLARPMRAPRRYTAFIVRGLLMLSVDTIEVSSVPGRDEWNSW